MEASVVWRARDSFTSACGEMPMLPDVIKGYAVAICSLFAGASVVHYAFAPDLVGGGADGS
jgi:hypothetical protein